MEGRGRVGLEHAFRKQSQDNHDLPYDEFLTLTTSPPPQGLGLHFKPGEATALFAKVDINNDGRVSLQELLDHFTTSQDGTEVLPTRKRIALVAHDSFKTRLVEWCLRWKEELGRHELMGTGTTARKVVEATGLPVEVLQSGPFGGDQQIGARISEHRCDMLIFFWDPLATMAHDQDVKALLRIASLYNVLLAPNSTTADMIISNSLVGEEVKVIRPNMAKYIRRDV